MRRSRRLSAAGQYAVARNDDGHRIAPHGLPDRTRRTRVSGLPRQCAVGRRLAPAYAAQGFVDAAMERAHAGEVQLDAGKVDSFACHVPLHVVDRALDRRRRPACGAAERPRSRRSVAAPLASGSCRRVSPSALQATPTAPMAVSKNRQ